MAKGPVSRTAGKEFRKRLLLGREDNTMHLKRLFGSAGWKGTENYLNTQKKYEVLRTVILFAVSLSLFAAGWIQTGTRANLLTIVAVLGFLPASRSLVNTIMFLRFQSCSSETAAELGRRGEGLCVLYDCVFTSYRKNYCVSHIAVRGNVVCGYTEEKQFEENEFYKHIGEILKADGHGEATVKIFTSLPKYTERLEQMKSLEENRAKTQALVQTIKSVIL